MEASAIRVGLLGFFGIGNLGNDASLEAMLLTLRDLRPGAEITCICPNPSFIGDEYGIATVDFFANRSFGRSFTVFDKLLLGVPRRISTALHSRRIVRQLDVLLVPGTGALDDYGTGPRGWPVGLFTWCLAARLRKVKVAFISIGAGPIEHPVSRWLMKSAARLAEYRSFRDSASREYMQDLGLDTSSDEVYPDLVFRLPDPILDSSPSELDSLTIGVGIMTYYGWRGDPHDGAAVYESYVSKLSRFVVWLLDGGYRVRLLVGKTDDQQAIDNLVTAVSLERPDQTDRLVTEPATSLLELMKQISETHAVVASRFHNIVCALKLCKPSVSIGYAEKNRLLMAEMGIGEFCQRIEGLDFEMLVEQFTELMADARRHEDEMRHVNAMYAQRIAQQERVLATEILQRRLPPRGGRRAPV